MQRREFLRNSLLLGASGTVPGVALAASQLSSQVSGNAPTFTGVVLPPLDDWQMFNLLVHAVLDEHLELVKSLIEQGASVHAFGKKHGCTVLHIAAQCRSKVEVVQCLVSQGADVNAKDDEGSTPLHHASKFNHIEVVDYLISRGANVHAKDSEGRTALDLAMEVKAKNVEVMERIGYEREFGRARIERQRKVIARLRRAMG